MVKDVFIFCPSCGTKFSKSDFSSKTCESCSLHFYINPSPSTGAILINEKDEIMLVKRRVDPGKGLWDIPGGFVDLNEDLEESLNRELHEELGIRPRKLKYIKSYVETYKYSTRFQQAIGTIFEAKISSSEKLTPADDISGYKFFSKKNIPIENLAFRGLKDFFLEYLKLDNKS